MLTHVGQTVPSRPNIIMSCIEMSLMESVPGPPNRELTYRRANSVDSFKSICVVLAHLVLYLSRTM